MLGPVDEALNVAVDALLDLERAVEPCPGSVRLDSSGPIAWITLDNPVAHNAMTVGMMRQLGQAVRRLHGWPGGLVAVASAHGGSFCSGGHLGQVRQSLILPEAAAVMTHSMATILDALLGLDAVSVSIVQGAAIGGGAELMTATDLRVATEDASVHFAQVQLGVACGWGGAGRLSRQIGPSAALRVLGRAERMSAASAHEIGFVNVVAQGSVDELLAAVAGPMLTHPVEALRAAKQQVRSADDASGQADAFLGVWGGPAHRRALNLAD